MNIFKSLSHILVQSTSISDLQIYPDMYKERGEGQLERLFYLCGGWTDYNLLCLLHDKIL